MILAHRSLLGFFISISIAKGKKFEAAGLGKDGIYRSNFNNDEDILIKMTSAKTKRAKNTE